MAGNGQKILTWVNESLPPLSWGVISIKMMRSFTMAGISPRKIDESTEFSQELVAEIRKVISDQYQLELPTL